jgi:hypothetical protein
MSDQIQTGKKLAPGKRFPGVPVYFISYLSRGARSE